MFVTWLRTVLSLMRSRSAMCALSEAAGDEVQDFGLAVGELGECERGAGAALPSCVGAEECVDLGHELAERGLAFEQQMVPALER